MRRVFANADWSSLSFHDVHIHDFAVFGDEREVRFDVDYLVEWERGGLGRAGFKICPATLVFDNAMVAESEGKLDTKFASLSGISRSPRAEGGFTFELRGQQNWSMTIHAAGIRLYLCEQPLTSSRQVLSVAERGPSTLSLPR